VIRQTSPRSARGCHSHKISRSRVRLMSREMGNCYCVITSSLTRSLIKRSFAFKAERRRESGIRDEARRRWRQRRRRARHEKWMDGRWQFGPPITTTQSSQFIIPCPLSPAQRSPHWRPLSTRLHLLAVVPPTTLFLPASPFLSFSFFSFSSSPLARPLLAHRPDDDDDDWRSWRAMTREIKFLH